MRNGCAAWRKMPPRHPIGRTAAGTPWHGFGPTMAATPNRAARLYWKYTGVTSMFQNSRIPAGAAGGVPGPYPDTPSDPTPALAGPGFLFALHRTTIEPMLRAAFALIWRSEERRVGKQCR